MRQFMSDEIHALHLTPSVVRGGSSGHALFQGGRSARRPFGFAPLQVLLVRVKQLLRASGAEFTHVIWNRRHDVIFVCD